MVVVILRPVSGPQGEPPGLGSSSPARATTNQALAAEARMTWVAIGRTYRP
jgi:hypothetical protein